MRGYECYAHKHPSMVPLESHHIWPKGYHGPDIKSNLVQICANAHSDVHYLLQRMLQTNDSVPWVERRTYGVGVRDLAGRGYDLVTEYAAGLAS